MKNIDTYLIEKLVISNDSSVNPKLKEIHDKIDFTKRQLDKASSFAEKEHYSKELNKLYASAEKFAKVQISSFYDDEDEINTIIKKELRFIEDNVDYKIEQKKIMFKLSTRRNVDDEPENLRWNFNKSIENIFNELKAKYVNDFDMNCPTKNRTEITI